MSAVVDLMIDRLAHRVADMVLERIGNICSPETEGEDLLDVEGAAQYLSLSKSTVYKLSSSGQLDTVKMGARSRFRRSDLDRYVEENHRGSGKIVALAAEARSRRPRASGGH